MQRFSCFRLAALDCMAMRQRNRAKQASVFRRVGSQKCFRDFREFAFPGVGSSQHIFRQRRIRIRCEGLHRFSDGRS